MSFRIKKSTSTFKTKGTPEPKEEPKETKTSKKKQNTLQAELNEKE